MPFLGAIEAESKSIRSAPAKIDASARKASVPPSPRFRTTFAEGMSVSSARHHARAMNGLSGSPASVGHYLVQLQRQCGNGYVQRVVNLAEESVVASACEGMLQRQDDSTDENNQLPVSSSVSLDEGLFVEDGQDNAGVAAASSPQVVRVQRAPAGEDIPPPPPAFPSVYEWAFDVFDDAGSLYGLTCEDRRERGFVTMWNEQTNKSFTGPTAIGDPAVGCNRAHINLIFPDDRPPLFPVGWFHTHPPANPGCMKLAVGPSDEDKRTSQRLGMPGMVMDTATPAADCKNSSYFFFGPARRSAYR
jgi:hypothetical protein